MSSALIYLFYFFCVLRQWNQRGATGKEQSDEWKMLSSIKTTIRNTTTTVSSMKQKYVCWKMFFSFCYSSFFPPFYSSSALILISFAAIISTSLSSCSLYSIEKNLSAKRQKLSRKKHFIILSIICLGVWKKWNYDSRSPGRQGRVLYQTQSRAKAIKSSIFRYENNFRKKLAASIRWTLL